MANIIYASITSNKQKNSIEEGSEDPPLFQMERASANAFVIDSKDRISGNMSEFVCDMGYQVMKGRYLTLKRVIIPKIPNVTPFNNVIRLRSGATVTGDITIPVGLYNTNSLANELTNQINAGFALAGILDTVTVSFDPTTRTFSLLSVGVIPLSIDETSSFIQFGGSLAPFESASMSVAPTKTTLYSSTAGMVYTRYITVSSDALTKFSFGNSIMSSAKQPPSLVGVVDLIDLYTPADFDITAVFNGVYRSITLGNPPRLRVLNPSRSIPNQIDISVRDMFGNSLNEVIQLGSPYPTDNSSIVLMFELDF